MISNVFTQKRVLFQGDSITDCDRDRTTNDLGPGYPAKVAEVYRCIRTAARSSSTGGYRETVPAICWHGMRRIFMP